MEHSPVHTHTQGLAHSHKRKYDRRKYQTTSKEKSVLCQFGQVEEGVRGWGSSEGTGCHHKMKGGREQKCPTNPEPLLS